MDDIEELRRKAALYDEAMKQKPVAWKIEDFRSLARFSTDPQTPGIAATRPDHICTPLFAHPIPQPGVRELVEQAFRDGFDWGEHSANAEHAWERGPTEDEAWADSDSRADLAKQETKP